MKSLDRRHLFVALLCLGLAAAGWFAYRFLAPAENGKKHVQRVVEKAASMKTTCNWAGFVAMRKTGVLHVFVNCNPSPALDGLQIGSRAELTQAITSKLVEPLLDASVDDPRVVTSFIVLVQKEVVACIDVKQRKIVDSRYDSYENYCAPR